MSTFTVIGRVRISTYGLHGWFGRSHHHMLAALFADGIFVLRCCLCIRDVRPCELAFCLVWSLGFTGVCSIVCVCVPK